MSKEQIDKDDREKRLNETAKLHLSRIKDFINQFDPKSPSDVLMVQLLNYCFITVSNELHKNMIQISKGINSGSDEAGKSIINSDDGRR